MSVDLYNLNPKVCAYCESPLPYKKRRNKCCNHSCAINLINLSMNNTLSGKYAKKKCLVCDNLTKLPCCSNECAAIIHWNKIKDKIESQKLFEGAYSAKRYLKETVGNKCAICNLEGIWENKELVLILDHINGNPCDHSKDNLRLLCPNCNSQTSTFKGKNKGNGRHHQKMKNPEARPFA